MTHSTHMSTKMRRYKKFEIKPFLKEFYRNYFPTSRDNLKQVIIKSIFIIFVVLVVISCLCFSFYYGEINKQENIINSSREVFLKYDNETSFKILSQQNSDYVGWLKIGNTKIDYPVYKAENNKFYLTRNGFKKTSSLGSIFMDYRSSREDKNIVIYGNALKNGKMFGELCNFRMVEYYNRNSILQFTGPKGTCNYKIFAVFVLNAKKEDDGGHIYNIYRKNFLDDGDFENWINEANKRSIINTKVDVITQDNILTLVTSCDDFENARLVIMARSQREEENLYALPMVATINKNPIYPKKWYENKGIEYPF